MPESVFFVVMGVVIVIGALFGMRRIGAWFNETRTPVGAVVFVLGGSLLMYAIYLGVTAAFTQQIELRLLPAFLFVPLAFTLVAVMTLTKRKKEPTP